MANKQDLVQQQQEIRSNQGLQQAQEYNDGFIGGTGAGGGSPPQREVSEEDIQEFTKRTGLTVFEASAKTGYGVESSFIALTDALVEEADSKAARGSSVWGVANSASAQQDQNSGAQR